MRLYLTLGNSPINHALRLIFLVNVVALISPVRNSLWDLGASLLPWSWMLMWPAARDETKRLAQRHADLLIASALTSVLILLGALSRDLRDEEWRLACVPIIWLPVAALASVSRGATYSEEHHGIRVALAAGTLLIAGTCCWQLLIERQQRPQGLFFGVLNGPLLLMMACLMWANLTQRMTQTSERWWCTFIAAAVFGAIATRAKTPFIAFCVATLIALLIDRKNSKRTLLISLPVIGFWGAFLRKRFSDIGSDMETYRSGQFSSSAGDRLDAMLWSQNHLLDHPWLGYGPNQLTDAFNGRWVEWGRIESSSTKIYHLHNEYLQLPLAHGIPAFIAVIAFWLLLSKAIYKSNAHTSKKTPLWLMVSILAVTGFTDCFSFWLSGWAACFTLAGLAVTTLSNHEGRTPQ